MGNRMNEAPFLGQRINRIKAHNMRAVLLSLLYHEPTYRAQLAKDTSLSTTTITNLVDELVELGVVYDGGPMVTSGRRRVGRPRSSLCLVADARYAIGFHLGVDTYRIGVANLKGEIVHSADGTFATDGDIEPHLEEMVDAIEQTVVESGIERQRLIGAGLGVAGLVNHHEGIISFAPNLGWHDVPIADFFARRLEIPVIVDNNVRAMALGAAFFGEGRGHRSLVFVFYSRAGLGAGIVVDNRILRGNSVGAGEIGHTIMVADGGKQCRCGNRGCLETLVSENVLIERAEELSRQHADSTLAAELCQASQMAKIGCIFDAARQGDPWALTAVDEVARYLGYALSNLVNVINPSLILLGGMFAQGEDLFIPRLEDTIQATAFAKLGANIQLQTTAFGPEAGIIGAAALPLTNHFYLYPEEL